MNFNQESMLRAEIVGGCATASAHTSPHHLLNKAASIRSCPRVSAGQLSALYEPPLDNEPADAAALYKLYSRPIL